MAKNYQCLNPLPSTISMYKTNIQLQRITSLSTWAVDRHCLHMMWMRVYSLDHLCSGLEQNGIGVWLGPEEPVTVVEVVVECLRDLIGVAAVVVLLSSLP